MLSNHGKQYKNKIEAMTTRKIEELNNDLLDLSTNTFNIINTVKNLIDVPVNKMTLYNQRNTMKNNDDDIYTNNVFKDVCNNYFRINDKGVIKQYDEPSDYVIKLYNKNYNKNDLSDKNFTDLNTYDEFIVDDRYNFIKGTNISSQGVKGTAHEGKYIFSKSNILYDNEMGVNKNIDGDCYTLKSGQTFSSEATYSNISSPFECKQLAIDNFYKHYILQKDADGSLNCYLSNNDNILNYYDASASACESESGFKKGININNSYGIFNNKTLGNKDNYRQGGYVDFDSNFVRKNQDLAIDNSNTYTFKQRKFASMESDVSCGLLKNDDTIIGYVQSNIDENKCFSVSNDILMDTTQRIYDANYNIIMKDKKYVSIVEPFEMKKVINKKLSRYQEVDIPTFTIHDILTENSGHGGYLDGYPVVREEIINTTNTITENNQKIYQELEKYNRILRRANLELSADISLNMNYVNNIEEKDIALNNSSNIEDIQELKRKLEDGKQVLGYNHNNYILWTLLGVAILVVLLKVSKPSNN
jgi:hypothetical protein|uniref:Uncharacterized protein n=1 Tax=viral metagenome TaxID=1070528 RepID=A0A6C0IL69_9ZZZZ